MSVSDLLDKRFCKAPDLVYRRIGDECLLVPIRSQTADLNYIFVLNPVAGRIWELLDMERSIREIRDIIASEYEVTPQETETDLVEFLQQLQEIDGVKEV
jgi:hypothetical protein